MQGVAGEKKYSTSSERLYECGQSFQTFNYIIIYESNWKKWIQSKFLFQTKTQYYRLEFR